MKASLTALLFGAAPVALLSLLAHPSQTRGSLAPPVEEPDSAPATEVHVDIRPGVCPNSINVNQSGDGEQMCIDGEMVSVLPVSVVGNKFSVDEINLATVTMSRTGFDDGEFLVHPIGMEFHDNSTPFIGEECGCHTLGGDGLLDLDLRFNRHQVIEAFALGDEENGALVELKINGVTIGEGDGGKSKVEFVGRDCVKIINNP